ncbi:MAG: phosphohydrolase [Kiritimatiellia bacterium]|jgi:hypothetical protein|nr:phosphohydrolase [Kiritimatiellia bacterium]MDP6630374.1 phosphohydrolase [Kiritimatiellia bacterium]MDP6809831.1 phosphohydrolase [Kiritimatiellia bacterium]MDP7024223.1 phosphohydrolase [Kiritimatiellia bacterium]
MGFKRCPGSSGFTQPKIELLECPDCRQDVEIWSDETTGKCSSCGKTVSRTSTPACMDWCAHAEECLGEEKYKQYLKMKAEQEETSS